MALDIKDEKFLAELEKAIESGRGTDWVYNEPYGEEEVDVYFTETAKANVLEVIERYLNHSGTADAELLPKAVVRSHIPNPMAHTVHLKGLGLFDGAYEVLANTENSMQLQRVGTAKQLRDTSKAKYTVLKRFPATGGPDEVIQWYDLELSLSKFEALIKVKELEKEERATESGWYCDFKISKI